MGLEVHDHVTGDFLYETINDDELTDAELQKQEDDLLERERQTS